MSNLLLTRRLGETLMIGDDVTVTVIGVNGNQVRLAVNAPADIVIDREEVRQRRISNRELIKGLYITEFRALDTDTPLCWIASTSHTGAEAAFLAHVHGMSLHDVEQRTIWDPLMACYVGTPKQASGELDIYKTLISAAQQGIAEPFIVPMPNQQQALADLEGAA